MTDSKDVSLSAPKMSVSHAAKFLGITVQGVHRQLKSKNIVCPKLGNKTYITNSIARQLFNLHFEKKIIVGQIVKGGTGKTTAIETISSCANTYGARILKIDIDPQGNLTDAAGIDPEETPVIVDVINGEASIEDCVVNISEGIDIIPSRIENVILENQVVFHKFRHDTFFKEILKDIPDNYDYVFIDCPPTMGQVVTCASLYADIILAPLNPDKFSAKGLKILKQEINTLNKRYDKKINYKVFLNKFSGNTILSDKAITSILADPEMEGRALRTAVRFAQEIPNTTDANKNLFSNLKKSTARDDFDQLTKELLNITPENTFEEERENTSQLEESDLLPA